MRVYYCHFLTIFTQFDNSRTYYYARYCILYLIFDTFIALYFVLFLTRLLHCTRSAVMWSVSCLSVGRSQFYIVIHLVLHARFSCSSGELGRAGSLKTGYFRLGYGLNSYRISRNSFKEIFHGELRTLRWIWHQNCWCFAYIRYMSQKCKMIGKICKYVDNFRDRAVYFLARDQRQRVQIKGWLYFN